MREKGHETTCCVRQGKFIWWVHGEDLYRFRDELLPALPTIFSSPSPDLLKATATRQIFRARTSEPATYVVKIFKRPGVIDKLKYLFRPARSQTEWRVGEALWQRALPTPHLVAAGRARRFGFLREDWIISREMGGTKPLANWVEQNLLTRTLPPEKRQEALARLAEFVRRLHDQGIYPTDFHQGNVLIQNKQDGSPEPYLIDLHAVRIRNRLPWRKRKKNLLQLNDHRLSLPDRLRFLNFYLGCDARANKLPKALIQDIGQASLAHWQHLWRKRKKKCLRPGKQIGSWRFGPWAGMAAKDTLPLLPDLLDQLNAPLPGQAPAPLKDSARISVREIVLPRPPGSRIWVVKHYKTHGFWSALKARFCSSRARKSWVNAHNLAMRRIPTARPVAFGEKRSWGLVRESLFITEKIPAARRSDVFWRELLDNPDQSGIEAVRKNFVTRLARVVRWMHQTGIGHGDLKASNILVNQDDTGRLGLFLVDLDGLVIRNRLKLKPMIKDISRIRAAFWECLSPAEQDLFIAVYGRSHQLFQSHKEKFLKRVYRRAARKIAEKQETPKRTHG